MRSRNGIKPLKNFFVLNRPRHVEQRRIVSRIKVASAEFEDSKRLPEEVFDLKSNDEATFQRSASGRLRLDAIPVVLGRFTDIFNPPLILEEEKSNFFKLLGEFKDVLGPQPKMDESNKFKIQKFKEKLKNKKSLFDDEGNLVFDVANQFNAAAIPKLNEFMQQIFVQTYYAITDEDSPFRTSLIKFTTGGTRRSRMDAKTAEDSSPFLIAEKDHGKALIRDLSYNGIGMLFTPTLGMLGSFNAQIVGAIFTHQKNAIYDCRNSIENLKNKLQSQEYIIVAESLKGLIDISEKCLTSMLISPKCFNQIPWLKHLLDLAAIDTDEAKLKQIASVIESQHLLNKLSQKSTASPLDFNNLLDQRERLIQFRLQENTPSSIKSELENQLNKLNSAILKVINETMDDEIRKKWVQQYDQSIIKECKDELLVLRKRINTYNLNIFDRELNLVDAEVNEDQNYANFHLPILAEQYILTPSKELLNKLIEQKRYDRIPALINTIKKTNEFLVEPTLARLNELHGAIQKTSGDDSTFKSFSSSALLFVGIALVVLGAISIVASCGLSLGVIAPLALAATTGKVVLGVGILTTASGVAMHHSHQKQEGQFRAGARFFTREASGVIDKDKKAKSAINDELKRSSNDDDKSEVKSTLSIKRKSD